jgi:hypothetical protein
MTRQLPLLLAVLAVFSSPVSGDEALGRLFFTPAQRAALDRERLLGIARRPNAIEGEASYTFNGHVKRSGGHTTRWINGEAQTGDTVTPPVHPGDTYHPATGERESLLGSGKITVRQSTAKP